MSEELLFKVMFFLMPIGFFISGFFMLRYSLKVKKRKEDCSVAAKGTIVKVIKEYNRLGDTTSRHIYYPVYEYMANGEQITVKSKEGLFSSKVYQVGTQVELYYNPQNTEQIYVPSDKAGSRVQTGFFWGGLGFLFAAVLSIVMNVLLK
ncbi:MAG: DUF3592 domain-containing protein [Lachnospiraceae bacterium]|nr:DUF3592 domain-containing protein [Lachnospiraceae bacterium]